MASSTPRSLPDLSKLEPLDGTNYKRWSQKLLIFFEQLEVDYVLLNEFTPVDSTSASGTATNQDKVSAEEALAAKAKAAAEAEAQKKFEKDNKAVRGHLLNHMTNSLFDLFVNVKSAKAIWDLLEKKYGADDAGKKKYVVGKWLNFKMVDDKPIMDQLHEYENLTAEVLNEGMKMCEILQANVLLEKFPPSWTDYRNQLKHKKRDLTLQELVSHMRTEEANRIKDKLSDLSINSFNANLVESGNATGKEKGRFTQKKGPFVKKPSFNKMDKKIVKKNSKVTCYVCGAPGHKAYQCFKRQGQPQNKHAATGNQANLAEADADAEADEIIAAVVEANLLENKTDWVLDTGASRHFSCNKNLFHDFEDAGEGECVYMGNSSVAGVLGKGNILLKLTSGKSLCLKNALYVPSMRRNLVSGALLNKAGMKMVFESDKVVLTRNGDFVGKGYLNGGLFVLNVASETINENASSSAYVAESYNIWHGRLGHVNLASIKKLQKLGLINGLDMHNLSKCEICVEAKFSKKPFKLVEHRESELLELIHSDLADFRNTTSRGGKKYYISFVDDFSRYTRI